jgi:hypothetical protein
MDIDYYVSKIEESSVKLEPRQKLIDQATKDYKTYLDLPSRTLESGLILLVVSNFDQDHDGIIHKPEAVITLSQRTIVRAYMPLKTLSNDHYLILDDNGPNLVRIIDSPDEITDEDIYQGNRFGATHIITHN